MSELKILKMSQILETHKMGIESQVTSHSENPTLHTRGSRCQETCWRFRGRLARGRGGHIGGRSRPRANHTSLIEKNFSTSTSADPGIFSMQEVATLRRLMSRLEIFVGVFSKEEVDTLCRLMSRLETFVSASSFLAHTGDLTTALNASATPSDDSWIIDSGASDHMTGISSLFSSYKLCSNREKVRIANGSLSSVSGKGSISVSPSMSLSSVLHIPDFAANLLSIARITRELNCRAIFYSDYCFFQDLVTGRIIGSGSLRDGLYYLDAQPTQGRLTQAYHTVRTDDSAAKIWLWHQRLGHPSFLLVQRMFPSLFLHNPVSKFQCETCELAKHHRVSFPPSITKSNAPFVLVHTDVWGPSRVVSLSGHRWFVSFIDDFSRTTWVYLLKDKSEVSSVFPIFHRMIQTQFNASIKIVRSDNGGEYLSSSLGTFFRAHGIIHQTTCVDTPQQNGVAERKNRHLLEVTRSLMIDMHVPKSYWGDALLTAAYLINRMPSRVLEFKTPLEVLSPPFSTSKGVSPKVFGCVCFVHIHGQTLGKLDPRALKCVFVGYSPTQKGYKCYHPHSRKRFVSMDVTFFESQPYFSSPQTSLQGESPSEEKSSMSNPLPVPAPMPEHDKQYLTDESPIDASCEPPPVTELRVYSRRQKSKATPDATCRTSDPDSGNGTPYL
jgi:transposase InsO family protein